MRACAQVPLGLPAAQRNLAADVEMQRRLMLQVEAKRRQAGGGSLRLGASRLCASLMSSCHSPQHVGQPLGRCCPSPAARARSVTLGATDEVALVHELCQAAWGSRGSRCSVSRWAR